MNYELRIKNTLKKVSNFEFRISNFLSASKRHKGPAQSVTNRDSEAVLKGPTFKTSRFSTAGFSLIELMVTVSIFVVITGIVLVKNSSFNSSIKLTNLVYEVALKVREAQTFGVSVREFGVGTARFELGYGVYFDRSLPTSFVFFADEDKDRIYDGESELIDGLSMIGGNQIARFCATPISGPVACSNDGSITKMTIMFERPKPESIILTDAGGVYQKAEIVLVSPEGFERSVEVDATGQISVKKD